MGNHWAIIFYYITIRLILNIFFKTLYIWQKTTKFGSQNFGYQIWFCTRLFRNCRQFHLRFFKGFGYLCNLSAEKSWKMQTYLDVITNSSPHKRLTLWLIDLSVWLFKVNKQHANYWILLLIDMQTVTDETSPSLTWVLVFFVLRVTFL